MVVGVGQAGLVGTPSGGNGKGATRSGRPAAQSGRQGQATDELKQLRAEVLQLKNALNAEPADAGTDGPPTDGGVAKIDRHEEQAKELQERIKAEREKLDALKKVDQSVWGMLFQRPGGRQTALEAQQKIVDDLEAAKRGAKPLKEQVDKATSFEKGFARQHAAAVEKQALLQAAVQEAQEAANEHDALVQKLADKMARAQQELCELTAKFVEAKRDQAVGPHAAAVAAAASFTPGSTLWGAVENLVKFAADLAVLSSLAKAGMPREDFETVEVTLRTVNGAAAAVQALAQASAPSASSPATADEEMELDEDQVECLARLEVDKLGNEGGEEDRAQRVASAKARIRSDFKVRKRGKAAH